MKIVLSGFMGAGKSAVGLRLSAMTGIRFIDLDDFIESGGRSIPQIFSEEGEEGFRRIEREYLSLALREREFVLSLGGGTLENPQCVRMIKDSSAIIIFLDTPFEVCYNRIKGSSRPLIKSLSKEELLNRYNKRRVVYMESADFTVNNGGRPEYTIEEIARALGINSERSDD